MNKKTGINAAVLNDNDRKVLDKYAGFYTNYIESNTAENELNKTKRHKPHA